MRVDPAERAEIQSVVVRLVHELDAKRWDALAACFTKIVRTDYTSLFGGEVQEQPDRSLIETWRLLLQKVTTQHLLGPIDVELEAFLPTLRSEDAAEGIQAFFGKRPAQFKGR